MKTWSLQRACCLEMGSVGYALSNVVPLFIAPQYSSSCRYRRLYTVSLSAWSVLHLVKRRNGSRVMAIDNPLLCPQRLVSEICLAANLVDLRLSYAIF